jgi:hypothetical protein
MDPILKKQLAHVLWIGGATDSGKSSLTQRLADRHGWHTYYYDMVDAGQIQVLAESHPEIRQFLDASLDERWVNPEPEDLYLFLVHSLSLRFPLVIDDLLALPVEKPILVEGFGLLPDFIHPVLSSPYQAIWFVPTETFKRESMERRGKPSFAKATRDPERARMNLIARDRMLADFYREHVPGHGYTLHEVDGSLSVEEMTELAENHFAHYLNWE